MTSPNRARWIAIAALAATIAACGGEGNSEDTVGTPAPTPAAPHLGAFSTFQRPANWIGQADETSEVFDTTASNFRGIRGTATGPDGKLYVSDLTGRRLMVFASTPGVNGASASFVLGAPDFTSGGNLNGPVGMSLHDGKLAVALTFDHQVAIFNPVPQASGATPVLRIGQQGTPGCAADKFELPIQPVISPDGKKLIVSDGENHRVLIWNALPTAAGQAPDLVLGQASLTHCSSNDDNQDHLSDPSPTARTLSGPAGVWTDGTRLAVVDGNNNRVLIWKTFPTTSFQPADLVLGQTSFTETLDLVTAGGFILPHSIAWNGRYLAVSDSLNNRVLLWDGFPTTNGASASVVLGQPDFATSTQRTRDAFTLTFPTFLSFSGNTLFVTETSNRLSIFKAAP